MVQRGPPIGVDIVHISMTFLNNCLQSVRFLLLWAQYGFVDRRLSENAASIIDFVATVDEIPQVIGVGLRGCIVQILNHVSSEFVLANLEGILCKGGRSWLSSEAEQCARCCRGAKIASDVQR